MILEEE